MVDEMEALDMATFAAFAVALYAVSAWFYIAGRVDVAALFAALALTSTAIAVGAAVNAIRLGRVR